MTRYGLRASVSITAVLLLMLVGVAAAVALWLWLAPHAASPAKPLPRLEVRAEAVKAYVVPGYGTYIGIFARNVGDASVNIKRLEELGLTVYVYDWEGDLVAVNHTARIVREDVPDGVWEPGELVVIEAFVPVELGYASLDTPGTGYRIDVYVGGPAGQGTMMLDAVLPVSNIMRVNASPVVCGILLAPGSVLTLPRGSVSGDPVGCSNATVSGIIGSRLIDVSLSIIPLNKTTSISFRNKGGDSITSDAGLGSLQVNSVSVAADNVSGEASLTVNNKLRGSASLPPLEPGKSVTISYGVVVKNAAVYSTIVVVGGKIKGSELDVWANVTVYAKLGSSGVSITPDEVDLGGVNSNGNTVSNYVNVYGYTLNVTNGYVLVNSIVERIAAVGPDCKPVYETIVSYNGGSSIPPGVTITGQYSVACVEAGAVFTPPWRG